MSDFMSIDAWFAANEVAREKKVGPIFTGTPLADMRRDSEGADDRRRLRHKKAKPLTCKTPGCRHKLEEGHVYCGACAKERRRVQGREWARKRAREKALRGNQGE